MLIQELVFADTIMARGPTAPYPLYDLSTVTLSTPVLYGVPLYTYFVAITSLVTYNTGFSKFNN